VLELTKVRVRYKHAIRIDAVCPGTCKTPLLDAATGGSPEAEAQWARFMPIGRLLTPRRSALQSHGYARMIPPSLSDVGWP
jgi:NAD(P)-dependent dehydrogenase (short-subunit alcohol dehydrogenase family)